MSNFSFFKPGQVIFAQRDWASDGWGNTVSIEINPGDCLIFITCYLNKTGSRTFVWMNSSSCILRDSWRERSYDDWELWKSKHITF